MSILNFNHTNPFTFRLPENKQKFYKLADIGEGNILHVRGFFLTPDNGYGEGASMVHDECYVNLPKHRVADVKEILKDQETIDQINSGSVYAKVISYQSQKNRKTCYDVEFYVSEDGDLPF